MAVKVLAPTFKSFSLGGDRFIAPEKCSRRCYSYEDKEISKIPNVHSWGSFENVETGFLFDAIPIKSSRDSTGAIRSMS